MRGRRGAAAVQLDQPVVHVLAFTGMRRGEMAGWHRARSTRGQTRVVEVFDENAGEVKAHPKGRRTRDVPLPGWLDALVDEALEVDPGECGLVHRTGRCRAGLVMTTATGA